MKFSRLICYGNLLLLAFALCAFRYGFFEQQAGLSLALNDMQFILLVISCVCIAAGGFIINNITGLTDLQIKQQYGVSESLSYYLYAAFNIIGVGIGFYLSNLIMKPGFALIFIVIAGTLYFYSTNLKYTLIVNNLVISVCVALSILILGVFDLYPAINPHSQSYLANIFSILIDFAFFAFVISFIREIIKDLRDVDKDYNEGINTLPIVLGKERTSKVVFALGLVATGMILYYGNEYIITLTWALIYGLIFILGPVIYFLIKIWSAKSSKEFNVLSFILKMVLAFTVLSIVLITFNIKYNA